MTRSLGVLRYEYIKSVKRWGIWLAFAVAMLPFAISFPAWPRESVALTTVQLAARLALSLNFLMPVVGGIVMADRLPRDRRYGLQELLFSTPLRPHEYVLGKFVGVLLSALTPVLLASLLGAVALTMTGAPAGILPSAVLAFVGINVPAFVFVGAFSIACPAILPVRVYQVLFTGYWFWGNFLNPSFLPTLNGTILTPSGDFVAGGLLGVPFGASSGYGATAAVLNLLVLAIAAALALFALDRYLAWQARRA